MGYLQSIRRTALILLILLLLLCGLALSQTSNVVATITDPTGQRFYGGTALATFVPTPGVPGPYHWPGGPLPQSFNAPIDATGTFIMAMPDNSTITPSGSRWQFTLCSNTSAPCQNVTTAVTGASPNLSGVLSAPLIAIKFGTGQFAFGYSDSEIITPVVLGSSYFNVTALIWHQWNGTVWVAIGGTSGGIPIPLILPGSSTTSVLDIVNPTAATATQGESSPFVSFGANYWDGTASQNDDWTFQNLIGNGTNGASQLSINHAFGSPNASVLFRNPVALVAPGVFTNAQMNEYVTSMINGCSTATEQAFQQTNATNAISACLLVPATTTIGAAYGITSYVQNNINTPWGVSAFYGQCRVLGTNGICIGSSFSPTDDLSPGNRSLVAILNQNPRTTTEALYGVVTGGITQQPGTVVGVHGVVSTAQFYGTGPYPDSTAFQTSTDLSSGNLWNTGYASQDGSASIFAQIGTGLATGPSDGQLIRGLARPGATDMGGRIIFFASAPSVGVACPAEPTLGINVSATSNSTVLFVCAPGDTWAAVSGMLRSGNTQRLTTGLTINGTTPVALFTWSSTQVGANLSWSLNCNIGFESIAVSNSVSMYVNFGVAPVDGAFSSQIYIDQTPGTSDLSIFGSINTAGTILIQNGSPVTTPNPLRINFSGGFTAGTTPGTFAVMIANTTASGSVNIVRSATFCTLQ